MQVFVQTSAALDRRGKSRLSESAKQDWAFAGSSARVAGVRSCLQSSPVIGAIGLFLSIVFCLVGVLAKTAPLFGAYSMALIFGDFLLAGGDMIS